MLVGLCDTVMVSHAATIGCGGCFRDSHAFVHFGKRNYPASVFWEDDEYFHIFDVCIPGSAQPHIGKALWNGRG